MLRFHEKEHDHWAGLQDIVATSSKGFQPNVGRWQKEPPERIAAMLAQARKERGKDAKLEPWRTHDLRRTCATGMAGIGIAPHIIEACAKAVADGHVRYVPGPGLPELRDGWQREQSE